MTGVDWRVRLELSRSLLLKYLLSGRCYFGFEAHYTRLVLFGAPNSLRVIDNDGRPELLA